MRKIINNTTASKVFIAGFALALFTLTGCSFEPKETDVTTTTYDIIITPEEKTESSEVTETTEETESETIYVPVTDSTELSEPLYEFKVNETTLDIRGLSIAELIEESSLKYVFFGSSLSDTGNFYFNGKGFGIDGESAPLMVEAMKDGELVTDFEESDFSNYQIKAINTEEFFSRPNCTVTFYGGIGLGSTIAEVEAVYGTEEKTENENNNTRCYKTKDVTMYMIFDQNDEFEYVVDEIYLFNN